MLQTAASGNNPGPSQGELQQAFTAQDVPQLSARIVAQKKLGTEAAKAKAEADAAMTKATLTLANAKRIAEEAKENELRLREELHLGISNGLDQLQQAQGRGGLNAGPPNGATVDGLDGDTLTLPARQIPANSLRPVIRLPEVNTPQPGVLPGALSQGDQAKIVVEQERVRALRHHEATMEARERDTMKYDPQYDFSFLAVC